MWGSCSPHPKCGVLVPHILSVGFLFLAGTSDEQREPHLSSLTSRLSPLTSYLISHLSPPTHLHLSPLLSSLVSAASSSWSGACISLGRWLVLTTASRPMACPDACMNTQSLQLSGPMACPDASPPLLLHSYLLLFASGLILHLTSCLFALPIVRPDDCIKADGLS